MQRDAKITAAVKLIPEKNRFVATRDLVACSLDQGVREQERLRLGRRLLTAEVRHSLWKLRNQSKETKRLAEMEYSIVHRVEEQCAFALALDPGKPKPNSDAKRLMANVARFLLRYHDIKETMTEGGRWCRLAAALDCGDPKRHADYRNACRKVQNEEIPAWSLEYYPALAIPPSAIDEAGAPRTVIWQG